jgi:hypothetical protein
MHVVKKNGIQNLLRKPEQEEPLGRIGSIVLTSLFERNWMGGLDCFVRLMIQE